MTKEVHAELHSDQLEKGVNGIIKFFHEMNLNPLQAILVLHNTIHFVAQENQIDLSQIKFQMPTPPAPSPKPDWN